MYCQHNTQNGIKRQWPSKYANLNSLKLVTLLQLIQFCAYKLPLAMPSTRMTPPGSSSTCSRLRLHCAAAWLVAAAGAAWLAAALLLAARLRLFLPRGAVGLQALLALRRRLRFAAALPHECSLPQSLLLPLSHELLP